MNMTKDEAYGFLLKSKIFVESTEISKKIQKKLYDVGIFLPNTHGFKPDLTISYIITDNTGFIFPANIKEYEICKYKTVSVQEILDINIIEEELFVGAKVRVVCPFKLGAIGTLIKIGEPIDDKRYKVLIYNDEMNYNEPFFFKKEELVICNYQPYEKVLFRSGNDVWVPAYYGYKVGSAHILVGGLSADEIIPYKGNEDLMGCKANPFRFKKTYD